jgi:TRAP-type mannitol/chloroaromatic compound transport system permease large subunit
MYKGAFVPGFMLTAMYVGYVVLIAIFKPAWAPALPPEARTIREDDGKSGLMSLLILTIISTGVAVYFGEHYADVYTWFKGEKVESVATDETIVVSMCAGVMLAFVIASINKITRMGLLSRMAERVTFVLIPPLLLIFLVLGTIFLGIATPTEGGAMGALGAFIMAMARGRLSMKLLKQALTTTTKLASFVVFILIGSTIFSLVFQGVDGGKWVEHLLTGLPGGQTGFLIVVNAMVFFLAFFLDFFELAFIVVPLLAPVADKLGIDLIWFGVLLGVNMQTSFMHPPFGFALFYLRSVAPSIPYLDRITKKEIPPVTTMQIYWGAVPFVIIQVVMVGLIIFFPGIVSSGLDKEEVYDMDKVGAQMGFKYVIGKGSTFGLGRDQLFQGVRVKRIVLGQHVGRRHGAGGLEDGLVFCRKAIHGLLVDKEVHFGATFPPARVVVKRCHLVKAKFLVVIRTDPFGRIDGAFFQRLVHLATRNALRHGTDALHHLTDQATAKTHLHAFEIGNGLDLLAVPATHLHARVAAGKTGHAVAGIELIHQLAAIAVHHPGRHLARIHAKWNRRANGKRRVFAIKVVGHRVGDFDRAVLHAVHHTKGRHQFTTGVNRYFELATRHGLDGLGHHFGCAVNGVERLWKARCQTPAYRRLGVHCGSNASSQHTCDTCVFDNRTTIHRNTPVDVRTL